MTTYLICSTIMNIVLYTTCTSIVSNFFIMVSCFIHLQLKEQQGKRKDNLSSFLSLLPPHKERTMRQVQNAESSLNCCNPWHNMKLESSAGEFSFLITEGNSPLPSLKDYGPIILSVPKQKIILEPGIFYTFCNFT